MRKLISLITLVSFSIQAATITDDKLTVGKKSSASDKEIVFDTGDGSANKKIKLNKTNKKLIITSDEALIGDGTNSDKAITFDRGGSNAQVKWNEVTDKLQFSNDGTTFKDLGTGGGGGGSTGVNVLTNDSFEDAVGGVITDWSNTGGTLTQQTYAIGSDGNLKYARFVASTSGQYVEQIVSVPTDFSAGCQADFKKVNIATASLFKVQALDASNNVLAEQTIGVSPWIKVPTISFPCPTSGSNNLKLRLISLAAGTIDFDRGYIGSNQNIVEAACQGTLECEDVFSASINTAGFVDGENLDWINGNCTISDTSLFRCSYTSQLNLIAPMNCVATTATGSLANFSQVSDSKTGYFEVRGGYISNFSGSLTYSPYNFKISCQKQAVDFVKAKPQLAVRNEQASWFIDANIGGGNASSSGNISTYTELTNPTLDLVINTSKGSASAEIACASGTASTGLTCTSNESVGIAFVPALTGLHRVCFDFGTNTSNNQTNIFQVIETPNTSQTILQEGGSRVQAGFSITTGSIDFPNKVCGNFVFSDTSKRTIRLMTESNGTGTILVLGDRNAILGQRDIHVTVENLTFGQNRPILTGDQVTMNGNKNYTFVGFDVSASGVVTNVDNPSIAPASCSVTSGNGTCVFPVTFANRPKCSVVIDQSSSVNQYVSRATPSGGNTLTYTTFIGSASTNSAVSIFCLVKLP